MNNTIPFFLIGIQAKVSCRNVGTETISLPDMQLSSTPIKGSIFRPSKRPRLLLEEEDDNNDDEDEESDLHVEPHDSTYNPESVVTEDSQSV